jgi:hypothetical protein
MRHGLYALGLLAVAGCNPYQNLDGDFYLGPVDAKSFQKPYQGSGFDPNASQGTITPALAGVAGGNVVAYYAFPTGADPLTIDQVDAHSRALVYVFDGDSSKDTTKCKKPSDNYIYNARTDFVRFDRQGNVFEDQSAGVLPDAASYVPVYEEVPVASNGEGCQTIHSAEGLVTNPGVTVAHGAKPSDENEHAVGTPDGKYLAVAVIDPRAFVLAPDGTVDSGGNGGQRFGFINHMLLAYIEGGPIPTQVVTVPGMMGAPDQMVISAKTATIYAPNVTLDMKGKPVQCDLAAPTDPMAPCIGLGADLIDGTTPGSDATRGAAGYSPICAVRTFTPADPKNLPTDPAAIDPATLDPDTMTFIYCLQVAQ